VEWCRSSTARIKKEKTMRVTRKFLRPLLMASVGYVMATGNTGAQAAANCDLLAPGGVTLTTQGEQKASGAADTLLKIAHVNANVTNETKKTIESLPAAAPADDPQALKTKALYLFCGMVANATDISTNRKSELFQQILPVLGLSGPTSASNPSPSQPVSGSPSTARGIPSGASSDAPSTSDVATKLGLPAIGSDKSTLAKFAAARNGSWSTNQGRQSVKFKGELNGKVADIEFEIGSDNRLSAIWWEQYARHIVYNGPLGEQDQNSGPASKELCATADQLVNFFVTQVDATPEAATTDQPALDAWGWFGGRPSDCASDCRAEASRTVHKANLEKGSQKIAINAEYTEGYDIWSDEYRKTRTTHANICKVNVSLTGTP
jgi:hypothetical protein